MFKKPSMLILITVLLLAAMHTTTAVPVPHESPIIELYIHDILGGSSPTARPITGLLGNIYNGQVPFARPLGFVPPQNGVAIPNSDGSVPTLNINGVPLGTGLSGTTFAGKKNSQSINTAQLLPDGLGLGFGTITVIDDILTTSPDLGSQNVGTAQGVYVASSADGSTQMMAFTAVLEGGEYGDSINFFGSYRIGSPMSMLSVTGGTGKFKNACGFAEVRPLIPLLQAKGVTFTRRCMIVSSRPYKESIKLTRNEAGLFAVSIPSSPATPKTDSAEAVASNALVGSTATKAAIRAVTAHPVAVILCIMGTPLCAPMTLCPSVIMSTAPETATMAPLDKAKDLAASKA